MMPRPFVFINSAMSADGKISSILHEQVRISGREDMARVDLLRAESDAVMVGVGTVLADDPGLRVKSKDLRMKRVDQGKPEDPLRVVADSLARTPPEARVLGPGCLLVVSQAAPQDRLEVLGKRCEIIMCGEVRVSLPHLMSHLFQRGVKRLMVEGGATLNWSMIECGLVDELHVYVGPMIIGGKEAPTLVDGTGCSCDFPKLKLLSAKEVDDGLLLKWSIIKP
jgi:2,5-diamino-6-(ribosylamino)-4(3H)-pyrimidinone 5'-phosphate reductase